MVMMMISHDDDYLQKGTRGQQPSSTQLTSLFVYVIYKLDREAARNSRSQPEVFGKHCCTEFCSFSLFL